MTKLSLSSVRADLIGLERAILDESVLLHKRLKGPRMDLEIMLQKYCELQELYERLREREAAMPDPPAKPADPHEVVAKVKKSAPRKKRGRPAKSSKVQPNA